MPEVRKGSSVTPLIHSFIDCEIKATKYTRPKLKKQGIVAGVGLRQGMPLSPLLANLVLKDFDASFRTERIDMVRYADDLLLFFHSKAAAQDGFNFVRSQLSNQGLSVRTLDRRAMGKAEATSRRTPWRSKQE